MAAIQYRPEIDGLRAIAVLSVLIFHLEPKWLPGGFVGVDVFFVISGFLISSIIYSECRNNSFSFARFYQRRVSRLFPAYFTVAFATILAAFLFQSPQDLASAGMNLTAATLSLANVKYMLQGNYFEISPDAQPFLHYWSLSVEEQFYMLFPALIFLLFRISRRWIFPVLVCLAVLSMALCIGITLVKPTWAFYLLPTRGWELLAGCLLGVSFLEVKDQESGRVSAYFAAGGLAAIVLSFFVISEESSFPGYIALLPVVGTVAVIACSSSRNWIGKVLSTALMVFIGKISYSLYLWHWPIYSFVDYKMYLCSGATRLVLKILLTIIATLACYFLIEKRTRPYLNRSDRQRLAFSWLAIMLVISVTTGLFISGDNYLNATPRSIASGGVSFGSSECNASIVLMGDSHASGYGTMCRDVAKELGYCLKIISVAAGDPLPACPGTGQENKLWNDSLQVVKDTSPEYVVLVMRWETKLWDCPDRLYFAVGELRKYAKQIILVTQPPVLPSNATRANVRKGERPPFFEPAKNREQRLAMNKLIKSFAGKGIQVIDIERFFGTPGGEVFYWDQKGQLLYHDDDHLSGFGTRYVKPLLKQAIADHRKKDESIKALN
jgi:peptidoglycan/LPS O-acetylase OafA/YrhL